MQTLKLAHNLIIRATPCASCRGGPRDCGRSRVSSITRVQQDDSQTSFSSEPARQVPLPNAMWLLDFLEDRWYDVRGQGFVVRRAESVPMVPTPPRSRQIQPIKKDTPLSMIHKVIWNHPQSVMLLEGPTVDVTKMFDLLDEDEQGAVPAMQPNSTVVGIVPVPQTNTEAADEVGMNRKHALWFSALQPCLFYFNIGDNMGC